MKTTLLLIAAVLLELEFVRPAFALTEAERDQAIATNTDELKRAVDAGDLDAATDALDALKILKKSSRPPAAADEDENALRKTDKAFETLRNWGFSLSRAPDADEGKGAYFGFTNDREGNSGMVWDAQFYLQWNMLKLFTGTEGKTPTLDLGVLRVKSLGASVQGKITSIDDTSTDAWRFRFESKSYLRIDQSKGGVLRGMDISIAAKDESDRDFHINRISGELWLTPVASRIYIGRFSGSDKDSFQFRWRPYVGIDAGGTTTDAAHADQRDANVWFMAKAKVELALNCVRNALGVKDVILSAEDRLVYLSERSETHNYLTAAFNIELTDSIGIALSYSVGEDSPAFTREDILTGGLTVKF